MDEKKIWRLFVKMLLLLGVVFLAVTHVKDVVDLLLFCVAVFTPFLVGAAIAYILSLPMNFIENKMFKKWQNPKAKGLKRGVSILLSILFVIALLAFLVMTVFPQLTRTVMELGSVIPAFFERLVKEAQELVKKYPDLKDDLAFINELSINWNAIITYVTNFLKNSVSGVVTGAVGIAGSLAALVFDGVISFVFAIYLLVGKEKLKTQVKKLFRAYLPEKWNNRILKVFRLLNHNFARFISGQCLEAVILGTMFVIAMTIFRMPYAVLVGVLIAFTALIPIVGAFIGCIVGAFLILLVSPVKALIFVVMFLVLQQVEGNLIYPRVVGNQVGLPAIWVLVAVSIGGSLFGVVGMLVFIPLMSTVYALLRENMNARLKSK